jgi:hypothetical protein
LIPDKGFTHVLRVTGGRNKKQLMHPSHPSRAYLADQQDAKMTQPL